MNSLFQLRVFDLGLLEDGNVGVGVFPEGEKILICRLGFDGVALQGVGASETEMSQRADTVIHDDAAMVGNFLELGGWPHLVGRLCSYRGLPGIDQPVSAAQNPTALQIQNGLRHLDGSSSEERLKANLQTERVHIPVRFLRGTLTRPFDTGAVLEEDQRYVKNHSRRNPTLESRRDGSDFDIEDRSEPSLAGDRTSCRRCRWIALRTPSQTKGMLRLSVRA